MGRPQLYDSNFCFRCKTEEKEKWKKYAQDKEKDLGEIIRNYLNELVAEKRVPMTEIRKPIEIIEKLNLSVIKSEIMYFINNQLDTSESLAIKELVTRFNKSRRTANDWLLEYRENVEPLIFDGSLRVWRRIK